jgi:hypothetical protein
LHCPFPPLVLEALRLRDQIAGAQNSHVPGRFRRPAHAPFNQSAARFPRAPVPNYGLVPFPISAAYRKCHFA